MCPNSDKRARQRGNSFTTCLLTVVIVFGGLGFYYFKYFQWRHMDKPTEGLTITDVTNGAQLNDFRKMTLRNVTDPLRQQLETIKNIRKKTKKGKEKYDSFDQEVTEIRNRLLEIMNIARLRTIPKKYSKAYNDGLKAIAETYKSLNELSEAMNMETAGSRASVYERSFKTWGKAKKLNEKCRNYFYSDESMQ